MTATIGTILGAALAGLTLLGIAWSRFLHPAIRAIHHFFEVVDELLEVLQAWPDREALINETSTRVTVLELHVSRVDQAQVGLRDAIQQQTRALRDHERKHHRTETGSHDHH